MKRLPTLAEMRVLQSARCKQRAQQLRTRSQGFTRYRCSQRAQVVFLWLTAPAEPPGRATTLQSLEVHQFLKLILFPDRIISGTEGNSVPQLGFCSLVHSP